MTLKEIIERAIPAETCPLKNANAMHRRKVLEQRINDYLAEKIKEIERQPVESNTGD